MAERRMFAKSIVLSDAFIDLPQSARCLYFAFGMLADDDGFINNPKAIMRQVGATNADLEALIDKRYLLNFEKSGVVVIKHWRINNYLQADRHKRTTYTEELDALELDGKGAYIEKNHSCIHRYVYTGMYTQDSIGKVSIGKDSIEREGATPAHAYGDYKNVFLTDAQLEKLKNDLGADYQRYIERLSEYMKSTGKTYKDHAATISRWAKRDREKAEGPEKKKFNYTERNDDINEAEILYIKGGTNDKG